MNTDTIAALERLQGLRNTGALSEAEFQIAKQQVLTGSIRDERLIGNHGLGAGADGIVMRPKQRKSCSALVVGALILISGVGAFYGFGMGCGLETYNLRTSGDVDFTFPLVMTVNDKLIDVEAIYHIKTHRLGWQNATM
jgi:hypothetical protein